MCLREYWMKEGKGPSKYEIGLACRCSSPTVYQAIAALESRGWVTVEKGANRSVKPTDFDRTVSVKPIDPWQIAEPQFWIADDAA